MQAGGRGGGGGGRGGGCTLHIGFDDTDSPSGMCTTYLAYKIACMLRRDGGAEFLDYPWLIRLNPNIPWKTRGNGAVSMRIRTRDAARVKEMVAGMVARYSDTGNGANPGLAFYEGPAVPREFADFSRAALWRLISRRRGRELAAEHGAETLHWGNGQGLVGAIGAIGYEFGDCTVELISYRRREMFGKRREILAGSVRRMQEESYPNTFGSYDAKSGRVMISPRGPDPVFYGLRGEDPRALWRASRAIRFGEELDGHMIFRSNQGTGDHLRNRIDVRELAPYTSGTVEGAVAAPPEMRRGGHVSFLLSSGGAAVSCSVYRPTGLSRVAMELVAGDRIAVGGGVRRSTPRHPRTVNVEVIDVLHKAPKMVAANPACGGCGKSMKSKGRGQGFACARCGERAAGKVARPVPRDGIRRKRYVPAAAAHRHLTRPEQRAGRFNADAAFDESVPWLAAYQE